MLVFGVQPPRERITNKYLCNFEKNCVAVEVCCHNVCCCDYTKFLARATKKQLESERLALVYAKSYDVFCKKVIETEIIGDKQIKNMKDLL